MTAHDRCPVCGHLSTTEVCGSCVEAARAGVPAVPSPLGPDCGFHCVAYAQDGGRPAVSHCPTCHELDADEDPYGPSDEQALQEALGVGPDTWDEDQ